MYSEINRCRICGNADLDPILDLGNQALTGVFPHPGDVVETGPLELVKCRENGYDTCGLVQLKHSFSAEEMYGDNYGYRSGLNRSMVLHLEGIAQSSKNLVRLRPGDVVLDIGSNDGTLLRSMYEPGVIAIGMDPTGLKFKQYYPEHIRLIPHFFSSAAFRKEIGLKRAKIISSIAMFYDLESPLDFMSEVKQVLASDGIWVFEQSYLPTMMEMNSYDTICHEHLEYYRLKQIVWMTERVGLQVLRVELNTANGGSFRIYAGHAGHANRLRSEQVAATLQQEEAGGFGNEEAYAAFRDRTIRHRIELRCFLERLQQQGKTILGCGASTKGNVLLQFCGLGPDMIPCIAEVNVDKFGRVTPGTAIPIVSEAEALGLEPDAFLVLPWHFREDFLLRSGQYLTPKRSFVFPLPALSVYPEGRDISHLLAELRGQPPHILIGERL